MAKSSLHMKKSLSLLTYHISFLYVTLLWDHTKYDRKTAGGRGQHWQGFVHLTELNKQYLILLKENCINTKGSTKTQETSRSRKFLCEGCFKQSFNTPLKWWVMFRNHGINLKVRTKTYFDALSLNFKCLEVNYDIPSTCASQTNL